MNSKSKGDIAELQVMLHLEKCDDILSVLTPFGDKARYDLVAHKKDNSFERIQVKYSHIIEGSILIKNYSSRIVNKKHAKICYTSSEIDSIFTYCPDNNKIYRVPINEIEGSYKMNLRIDESMIHTKNTKYAKDYEF